MSSSLNEDEVIEGFHSLLRDSLAQARGEGLLTDDELESAEPAVQIAAPALALFFAALGSTGTPPSISSPDSNFVLSSANCPSSFANAFQVWQACVRPVQRLSLEARHDLALLLCDKEPVASPLSLQVARLASDLKAIALEILQRRTFQTRFQSDLNVALDSSVRPRTSVESNRSSGPPTGKTSLFEPPPMYSAGRPTEDTKRAYADMDAIDFRHVAGRNSGNGVPGTAQQDENLNVIRETLYSAFADAIVDTPSILEQLSRGPAFTAQAFFASTCLAILEVALTRLGRDGVRVVEMGRGAPTIIGISETPEHLRPFLAKLVELSQAVQAIAQQDDVTAMREAATDAASSTPPRIGRLRDRLAKGVSIEAAGREEGTGTNDSPAEQELRQLGNAINEMALGMTALPAFRERQAEAFKVLIAVTAL
ncbi:hypothetical protein JCM11491_004324 [Sporobolomyces phaffii]